ncbi:RNA-binding transcriptional accessory protein [Marinomonas sp. M1K-6]|uniref:RNA-binding transcriptional accessory protein n=1 Tax=Marinomonas profundi TaxID=2726122 RepID=A0A847RD32_9GAMM|nr:Tex family protein [Marinomonas profundi]NLQ18090.1 RNA-binding transcriptional accessory protein [Marinomonas profundi]UDV04125.1 RNA-binding transcriptional accessory protein [Marinomonas profundi]
MNSISDDLSLEFSILKTHSDNIIQLFQDGATVPFVARYRKESTGGMSDVDLRTFYERWQYLVEFKKRKESILALLMQESNVSNLILDKIRQATSKSELEDLYAPFKKTRKSKADEARDNGLDVLAEQIWSGQRSDSLTAVDAWCRQNRISLSAEQALEGVVDIVSEVISNDSEVLKRGRALLLKEGVLISRVLRGKKQQGEKFRDYFDYQERINNIPAHRLLALFRGKKESILKLNTLLLNEENYPEALIFSHFGQLFNVAAVLSRSVTPLQRRYLNTAWEKKLLSKLETDVLAQLKERAEEGAIQVFANNLQDLLMAAPAGAHRVLGLDPGFRNGVKLAVIGEQGELLDHGVIYPHGPQNRIQEANALLLKHIKQYRITWVAIGNGTASRETELLVRALIAASNLECRAVVVSEAGASVYSASPIAIQEFPDLDVTIRGAVSIARRFQDPLAELVKIDPQAIGVGQYQHDVKAAQLSKSLAVIVEDCVNRVGVDINLASVSLLSYVSGLTGRLAQNIVDYRQQKGRIESRAELLKIKGVGDKCFEQCAGFLRVLNGKEPLDQSGVHPESYALVHQMAAQLAVKAHQLLNNGAALQQLKQLAPTFGQAGDFTYSDILAELAKPGRDPRPEFRYASFDQRVQTLEDVHEGMTLEGVVTNVAAFGAFVDLGVHQDGLIHISQLADRFVKDPRDFVRVGQVVTVTVLEVDVSRKRIALKANGL